MARYLIPQQPDPLTAPRLREIQARRRGDPDIRLLLLEVKRLRDVVARARKNQRIIEDAWTELKGGHIVVMHEQKNLLQAAIEPD